MRQSPIGSTGSPFRIPPHPSWRPLRPPARWWFRVLMMAIPGGLFAAMNVAAQTATAPVAAPPSGTSTAPTGAGGATPLARFVPRDNLILYLAFDGLDAHSEAWQKTAAYKMLNTTPLGVMLEEVAAQLLDRALSSAPNKKLTGAEFVTLIKTATKKGWLLAIHATAKPESPIRGTLVLRGMAAKEVRSLSSRLMGMLMGSDKPKIERRSGRVLVLLSSETHPANGVWWPEKDDLVLGLTDGSEADTVIAALDGKTPSAADHAVLNELSRPEGTFMPLMTALVDPVGLPAVHDRATEPARGLPRARQVVGNHPLRLSLGLRRRRADERHAPGGPRAAQAGAGASSISRGWTPSISSRCRKGWIRSCSCRCLPPKVLDAVTQIGPPGQVRAKVDEALAKLKSQGRMDFEKEFLGNLGPRMALYLSPSRSAATTDETPEGAVKPGGIDPMAMLSSLQSALPKPTLVAELRDPVAFGKALDVLMITVNKELKAQAIEKAAQEEPAEGAGAASAPRRRGPARGRARTKGARERFGSRVGRRRQGRPQAQPEGHSGAEFRPMPGTAKTYMLFVPTDSPLKLGTSGVHPTLRIEGKYLAVSSTSEAPASRSTSSRRRRGSRRRRSSKPSLMCRPARSSSRSATRARRSRPCWPACRGRSRPRSTR